MPVLVFGADRKHCKMLWIFRNQSAVYAPPHSEEIAYSHGKGGTAMKEMDILEMIGEARADYILDAQSFQKD